MTFAALADPVDIARAHAAVDAAWESLTATRFSSATSDLHREALADIVASYVLLAANDHELVRRSIAAFSNRSAAVARRANAAPA